MIESKGEVWEEVSYTKFKERTERIAVPGGWLYRTHILPFQDGPAPSTAMCFVPKPFEVQIAGSSWVEAKRGKP